MKNLVLFVIASLIVGLSFSQQVLYQEQSILHTYGRGIFPSNGGYDLITGYAGGMFGICKLDSQFDSLWFRAANFTMSPEGILPGLDSGYFLSGLSRGIPAGFRAAGGLLSPSGYSIWQTNSVHSGFFSYGRGSTITADSGYLVVGLADSGGVKRKVLLMRVDRQGNVVWEKIHQEANSAFAVTGLQDGFLVPVTGVEEFVGPKILKFNLQGDFIGERGQLPYLSIPVLIKQLTPNRFVVLSEKAGMLVSCFDSLGTLIWEHTFLGFQSGINDQYIIPRQLQISNQGDVYLTGDYSWIDIDSTTTNYAQIIIELDANGNVVWNQVFASGQRLDGRGLTLLPDGRILALSAGNVANTHDEFYSLIAEFGPDTTTAISPLRNDFALRLQPQPVTDILEISLSLDQPGDLALTLIDLQGRTVLRQNRAAVLGENRFYLDLGSYPAGVYVLRAESNGRAAVQKVVKQ